MSQRHPAKTGGGWAPPDMDPLLGLGGTAQPPRNGAPIRDDVTDLLYNKVGVRQIDWTEDMLPKLDKTELLGQQKKFAMWMRWAQLIMGALYIVAGAVLCGLTIRWMRAFMLFWDPMRWSTIDHRWEVALERVGPISVTLMLSILLIVFGIYHLAHFVPFVHNIYVYYVFIKQANPLRWGAYASIGALLLGGYGIIEGVSNVMIFVALIVYIGAAALIAFYMEVINRPHLIKAEDFPVEGKEREAMIKKYALKQSEVRELTKPDSKAWYVRLGKVSPWPLALAALLALVYITYTWSYFWTTVTDTKASLVPWFSWVLAIWTAFMLVVLFLINAARYLLTWSILQNYFYIDLLHQTLFEFGIFLGPSIAVIIGILVRG